MPQKPQSFDNHMRFRPGYHYVVSPLVLLLVGWAAMQAVRAPSATNIFLLLLTLAVSLAAFWARAFALGVQDRLIRLEERLRMERVLPDGMKARIGELTTDQLVGLRFASDAELPALTRRVLEGEITRRKDIKRAVRDWRADHERI